MCRLRGSRLRVRSLLIERHPATAVHPKARGINARTMEMYRQLGVEAAIRQAGLPLPDRADVAAHQSCSIGSTGVGSPDSDGQQTVGSVYVSDHGVDRGFRGYVTQF